MLGWADLDNGDLLWAAEGEYAVLVTLDTNLIHKSDVGGREISVLIIDVHPIVPGHLKQHLGKTWSALPTAAGRQAAVMVRDGGIDLPPSL